MVWTARLKLERTFYIITYSTRYMNSQLDPEFRLFCDEWNLKFEQSAFRLVLVLI